MSDPTRREERLRRLIESEAYLTPDGRAELDEAFEGLVEELDAAGEDVREEVTAARGAAEADPRVAETLRRLAREETPAAPRSETTRGVRPTWWLAAAVVLIGLGLGLRAWLDAPEDPGPQVLGSPTLELTRPVGEVERYGPFRWSGELPDGGWFVVRLFAEGATTELAASPRLTAFEWSPPADVLAEHAAGLEWWVERYEPDGTLLEAQRASASLRSP